MKRILTAIAAAVVLTAASAQATTFPGLTLIYVAAGAVDFDDGSGNFGTTVPCTNQSGTNATVRWRFFNSIGSEVGLGTVVLENGRTVAIATTNGTFNWPDSTLIVAQNFFGKVAVYSTQSAVFCSALVANSNIPDAGTDLHMVRFNAHPGTVE